MKNNHKKSVYTLFCALSLSLGTLTSCDLSSILGGGEHTHQEHKASNEWGYDEHEHWHTCSVAGCDEVFDIEKHNFKEEVETEPTCTSKGVKRFTCECGYSYTKDIDFLEHVFGEWTVTIEPTCTTEGEKQRKCNTCDETETESIPKLEHVFGEEWLTSQTEHWHKCKTCDEIKDKANHTYGDWVIEKEATCTEEGLKYRTCTVCDYKVSEIIPIKDHVLSEKYLHDETNHWKTCENCENKLLLGEHTFGEWKVVEESTCLTKGSEKRTCTVCGYEETRELPLGDHKYDTYETTSEGHAKKCSVCGDVLKFEPHDFGDWIVTKEPTCAVEGWRSRTCKTCKYHETDHPAALGHIPGEYQADADYHWKNCTRCGERVPGTKVRHTIGDWEIVTEATCEHSGLKQKRCSVCGYVADSITLPQLRHSFKQTYEFNETHCWRECEFCHMKMSYREHVFHETGKRPTCYEDGIKTYTCANCKYSYSEVLPKYEHNYVRRQDDEFAFDQCTYCGDIKNKVAHTYELIRTVEGDCNTKGYRTYQCTTCGHNKQVTYYCHRSENTKLYLKDAGRYPFWDDNTWVYECKKCNIKTEVVVPSLGKLIEQYNIPVTQGEVIIDKTLANKIASDLIVTENVTNYFHYQYLSTEIEGTYTYSPIVGNFKVTKDPFADGTNQTTIIFENLDGTKFYTIGDITVDLALDAPDYTTRQAGTNSKGECLRDVYLIGKAFKTMLDKLPQFKDFYKNGTPDLLVGRTAFEDRHCLFRVVSYVESTDPLKAADVVIACGNCNKTWSFYVPKECIVDHGTYIQLKSELLIDLLAEQFKDDPYFKDRDSRIEIGYLLNKYLDAQ